MNYSVSGNPVSKQHLIHPILYNNICKPSGTESWKLLLLADDVLICGFQQGVSSGIKTVTIQRRLVHLLVADFNGVFISRPSSPSVSSLIHLHPFL